MTALSSEAATARIPIAWRRWLPAPVGIAGGLALLGLYLTILSLLQSPAHAFEQLGQDWIWVGLVSVGFGTQIGLYAYLRQIIQAMKLAGATALTGAATGTSTLGMVACCAHHVTDIAPLLGLTGASGLSGIVTFLGAYKIPFIIFGLLVNLVGIVVSLRTIRRQRAHLHTMKRAVLVEPAAAPACH